MNHRAGDISIVVPPVTWPLFPPHTGSCPSTPVRCPLSPRGRRGRTADAQHPGTLEDKQSVLQSLPAYSNEGNRGLKTIPACILSVSSGDINVKLLNILSKFSFYQYPLRYFTLYRLTTDIVTHQKHIQMETDKEYIYTLVCCSLKVTVDSLKVWFTFVIPGQVERTWDVDHGAGRSIWPAGVSVKCPVTEQAP